ncbi:MAG: glycerol kinase GlpK [Cyanobacteria bacterium P01_A01_bin.84]
MANKYILALDNGTTGNRAFIFNQDNQIVAQEYQELTQHYPHSGWLEHDPNEIWSDTYSIIKTALEKAKIKSSEIDAIGLTVQRETCLLWDKNTGEPLHNAIVWQDRRTAAECIQLQKQGYTEEICNTTGLVIDAYFSASKYQWLLSHLENIDINNTLAGTIDTWILWKLTGGRVHATDHSNASRTMLMNIINCEWDPKLLDLFQIPSQILPEIKPSFGYFGITEASLFGAEIPITAILGDQQAALFGHGCNHPGLMKCTYGTGSFLVSHTGEKIALSENKLLATVAWTEAKNNTPNINISTNNLNISYALEASMFTSGACIQWLRDGIKLIQNASETENMATSVEDNGGVYFVPAFSGLGAPHWDMNARGAFLGITGGVKKEHMVRAVLEAIAYQVKEAVETINTYSPVPIDKLIVDGGASENNFLMQFQADLLRIPVERPIMRDITVRGIAFAAGLASGFWENYEQLIENRQIDQTFIPNESDNPNRDQQNHHALENFIKWQKAVTRAKNWTE